MRLLIAGNRRPALALLKQIKRALPNVSASVNELCKKPSATWHAGDIWLATSLGSALEIACASPFPRAIAARSSRGRLTAKDLPGGVLPVPRWPRTPAAWQALLATLRRLANRRVETWLLGPALMRSEEMAIWVDRRGRVIAANRSACQQLDLKAGNLFRRQFNIGAADWEALWRGSRRVEIPLSGAERSFPAEISTSYFNLTGKRIACFLIRDTSTRKQVARDLAAARDAATLASRQKDRFIANMSHEVRTPLAAIQGFAETMALPETSPAERKEHIERIRRNVRSLTQILDDLLDLSKVSAGKMAVEPAGFSLASLLSDVRQTYETSCARKGIGFSLHEEGELPDRIVCDQNRLRQILLNVVGNAVKFTSQGCVDVGASAEAIGGHLALNFRVRDSGRGIPSEKLSSLFEPFGRLHSGSEGSGTGLGLALSRELARALGGDLTLEWTEPEVGSEFRLTIAIARDLAPAAPLLSVASTPSDHRLKGLDVLVAEDDPDYQAFLKHMIELEGASVWTVSDGIEAVALASRRKFDVILMDVDMPKLGGLQAVEELRNGGNRTPMLALTAFAMKGDEERCLEQGCDDYLSKPIDPERLLDTVARYGAWKAFATPRAVGEGGFTREEASASPRVVTPIGA